MTLRTVSSGLRPARENLSITEALRRSRAEARSPDTLRFQHFPPSAIIGRHQILHREIHLDWCAARGVEVARRMTGGGAIVMGPGILGWELVLARGAAPASLDAVTALICEAVAAAIRSLGPEAVYRPRNDIEVGGRKVSGTGGYSDGDTIVFQGTVLIALDPDLMAGALRLPTEKLERRNMQALTARVTDLRSLLGTAPPEGAVEDALTAALSRALDSRPVRADLASHELDLARTIHDAEIGTDRFVLGDDDALPPEGRVLTGRARTPGGTVEVVLKLRDGAEPVLDQAVIAGDFFAEPPDAVHALEARLRGHSLSHLPALARNHLAGIRALGIPSFAEAVIAAAESAS